MTDSKHAAWLTFVLGIISSIITYILGRGKAKAEPVILTAQAEESRAKASATITDATTKLTESYEVLVNRLINRMTILEKEVEILKASDADKDKRISELEKSLEDAGHTIDNLRQENLNLQMAAEQLRDRVLQLATGGNFETGRESGEDEMGTGDEVGRNLHQVPKQQTGKDQVGGQALEK